jgi:hypothetical protein
MKPVITTEFYRVKNIPFISIKLFITINEIYRPEKRGPILCQCYISETFPDMLIFRANHRLFTNGIKKFHEDLYHLLQWTTGIYSVCVFTLEAKYAQGLKRQG